VIEPRTPSMGAEIGTGPGGTAAVGAGGTDVDGATTGGASSCARVSVTGSSTGAPTTVICTSTGTTCETTPRRANRRCTTTTDPATITSNRAASQIGKPPPFGCEPGVDPAPSAASVPVWGSGAWTQAGVCWIASGLAAGKVRVVLQP